LNEVDLGRKFLFLRVPLIDRGRQNPQVIRPTLVRTEAALTAMAAEVPETKYEPNRNRQCGG
jgi:hypothetical protein